MAIAITITGDARELEAVLRRLEGGIEGFSRRVRQSFDDAASHTTRATQRMQQAFSRMHQQMERNFQQMNTIMRAFQAGLATFGVASFTGLVKGAVDTAAGFQQLDTQLRFTVGTLEEFQRAKQFIIDFTATTPFQLNEVTAAFVALTRRGLESERVLKAVADASAVQRFPSQSLDRMVFAIGQIADRGKLAQQELNQLSEAGVAQTLVLDQLRRMGVKWGDDIGAAGIKASVAIEAVVRALEENFTGALAASQANWILVMSNLVDTWNIFQAAVVNGPLIDFITSIALVIQDDLTNAVKNDQAAFRAWGETAVRWLKDVLRWIASVLDALASVGRMLDSVSTSINNAGTRVNEFFSRAGQGFKELAGGALQSLASGLEFGLAPTETVEALRKTGEALQKVGEQGQASAEQTKSGYGSLTDFLKGEYTQSLETILSQGETKMDAVKVQQQKVFDEQAKRIEAIRKRLTASTTETDLKAAQEAGNIAAERARAEEQTLEASLRRQVEMTKIAADEQRRALDKELDDRLSREPAAHEAIQLELQERRRDIAISEAEKIYQIEVDLNQRILKATEARLQAEIRGAAGKPVQIAKFEADLVAARADADTEMAKSAAKRAQAEQQVSKQTLDQRLEDIAEEEKAVVQGNQAVIQSRLQLLQAEEQLLNAEQKTGQRGGADQRAQNEQRLTQIRAESFAMQEEQIRGLTRIDAEEAMKRIQNGELLAERLAQINEEGNNRLQELNIERQTDEQRRLDEQLREYERFVEDVENELGDFLFDLFSGQIDGIKGLFESLKTSFFRMIADMIAFAIARPIIVPIITSIVGGAAGLLGGATGTGGGGLFDALGLAGAANQGLNLFGGGGLGSIFGPTSAIGQALSNFTAMLNSATANVGGAIADVFGITNLPASGLTALGGLAGIGGGLYSAFTAQGMGGMTGGAIGAAGGAAALISGLGLIGPIFGPIGLALSALAPLLGNLIDTLGAPKGPRFVLGELEGLDVAVENGMLQVAGTLTSAVGKAERLPEGQSANAIQSALEAGLQDAVTTMVNTINAVALDPEALLIPTQQALETALDNAMVINSASAENFAEDIAAQTLAVITQIATAFLGPLADALDQIFAADLETQLRTLPNALNLAVAQLTRLTDAVTAIQDTGQTDASNVVPQLLDQIATFRSFIIDSTIHTLEDAFTSGIDNFQEALQLAVSIPQGVIDLHAPLAGMQAMAQGVLALENQIVASVDSITTSMTPLSTQMQDVRDQFLELQASIAEAGDNIAVALPLYTELHQAILQEANLRIQQVQAIGATLESIEQTLFGQLSPGEQQQQLLADIAALEAEMATQTGSEQAQTAAELAALNQQLLAMGESTDNLALTMEAIANLEALQPILEQQMLALGGSTDVQTATMNIQQQSLDTLKSMEEDLYNLFLSNQQVQNTLGVGPVPVVIVGSEAAQMGKLIGYAQGGLVPAMLESGERAFYPPMNMAQQSALMSMNRAFPRFGGGGIVPGTGSGDTVPALLPSGSFILNRRATSVLGRGYQTGGEVASGTTVVSGTRTVNINIGGNWQVRNEQDKRDIVRGMIREIRDELHKLDGRTIGGR